MNTNEFLYRSINALQGNNADRARERNNVGFSSFDTPKAETLQEKYPKWTQWDAINAWTMLQKYKAQLMRNHAIDITSVPKPELPTKPVYVKPVSANRVDYNGSEFTIESDYNESLVFALRSKLQRKRWDGETKRHICPATQSNMEALQEILKAFTFLEASEAFKNHATVKIEANLVKFEASSRQSSEFKLEGFGFTPRPFQAAGIETMVQQDSTLLADDMGLGKTIQTLGCIHHWNEYPALVIAPANLKWQWASEICKGLPDHVTVGVIDGRKLTDKPTTSQKRLGYPSNKTAAQADVIVINYDLLSQGWSKNEKKAGKTRKQVDFTEVFAAIMEREIKVIALDESHYIKNDSAQRTIACLQARKGIKRRICATGTPIENAPVEIVPQLEFLDKIQEFGGSWQFKLRYCDAKQERIFAPGGPKMVWNVRGASNQLEMSKRLKETCMIRRLKDDVLTELPPKQRIKVQIDLDNWKEYQAAEAEIAQWAMKLAMENQGRFEKWCKERSLQPTEANRTAFGYERYDKAQRAEQLAKFNVLKQIASKGMRRDAEEWLTNFHDQKQKAIIFADFIETQDHYFTFSQKAGYSPVRIQGGMSGADRDQAKNTFQSDKNTRDIVCSMWAAAEGLNLQAAQDVIFMGLPWNPSKRNQMEDRAHRMGQTGSCFMWYLIVPGTIYDDIDQIIESKASVSRAAIDGISEDSLEGEALDQLIKKYAKKAISKESGVYGMYDIEIIDAEPNKAPHEKFPQYDIAIGG